MRESKQLLHASCAFAHERRGSSWWALLSTLTIFVAFEWLAASRTIPMPVRVAASVFAGLVMVRLFILYHDHQHNTIFKKSPIAWAIMSLYGLLVLNPPSIWRRSHDHHHKHNSKMFGASIGSFPIMTTQEYLDATPSQRLAYRVSRHPLTFVFGYITVFFYGMCIRSLLANPRLHADSILSIALHVGLGIGLAFIGWDMLLLTFLLPSIISAAMGAYLFYAQHNFPDAKIKGAGEWDYVTAALHSSSFIEMSPVMHWFTGNIGYHHVHHLNHHIPFYRLPEAMDAMPELQSPGRTSLKPRDVLACLRLKVWDSSRDCFVGFPDVRSATPNGDHASDDGPDSRNATLTDSAEHA